MVLMERQFVPSHVALTFSAISRVKVSVASILAAVLACVYVYPFFLLDKTYWVHFPCLLRMAISSKYSFESCGLSNTSTCTVTVN